MWAGYLSGMWHTNGGMRQLTRFEQWRHGNEKSISRIVIIVVNLNEQDNPILSVYMWMTVK
jgi:hypothetical protein